MAKDEKPATDKAPETNTASPQQIAALDKIIKTLPGTCSFDMDEGAIFGRCVTRVRAWLKEHELPIELLAKNMDRIQSEVAKHIADRDAAARVRAAKHADREAAALDKALEG